MQRLKYAYDYNEGICKHKQTELSGTQTEESDRSIQFLLGSHLDDQESNHYDCCSNYPTQQVLFTVRVICS